MIKSQKVLSSAIRRHKNQTERGGWRGTERLKTEKTKRVVHSLIEF